MTLPDFIDVPELGIPEIDAEHALQVQLVRSVKAALTAGDRSKAIQVLAQLDDFTNAHFIAEQLLMRLNGYPGYRGHEDEHDKLIEDLRRLRYAIAAGQAEDSVASASSIERWLGDHIRTADRALAVFLRQKTTPPPQAIA